MKELNVINTDNMMEALEMVVFGVAVELVVKFFTAKQERGMFELLVLLDDGTNYPTMKAFFESKEQEAKNKEEKELNEDIIKSIKEDIQKIESKKHKTSKDLREINLLKEDLSFYMVEVA